MTYDAVLATLAPVGMRQPKWALLVLLGLSAGCVAPQDGQFLCSAVAPVCPDGWTCRADGRCYATAAGMDGGAPDASRVDAARRDGDIPSQRDGSPGRDGAALDAAGIDAAGIDAAGIDAAGIDAAGIDAAGIDAAGIDASAATDSGTDGGGVRPDATAECTSPANCDDANPCTDDACIDRRCVRTNNGVVCNDGVFCNGADTCGGGSCSVHAGDPCPGACVSEACVDCGGFGEACCDGGACDGFRSCVSGTVCGCERGDCGSSGACDGNLCAPCGPIGLLCCDDGTCEIGVCASRVCGEF